MDPAPARAADPLRVRKDAKDLTAQEKQQLVAAYHALKQTPSPWDPKLNYYDQFVYWHKYAFACDIDTAHMGPVFLPWHRQYLMMFEDALRDVSGLDITLPYWNFTDQSSTDAVFSPDFMDGDGDPNQGYAVVGSFGKENWVLKVLDPPDSDPYQIPHLIRRRGTPIAPTLPTVEDIEQALSLPAYDAAPWNAMSDANVSFRNNLEGWRGVMDMKCESNWMDLDVEPDAPHDNHNRVHLWAGGVFPLEDIIAGNPDRMWSALVPQSHLLGGIATPVLGTLSQNTSPNDPVFFLLHANIDRIWNEWEQRHGKVYLPVSGAVEGQNLNDPMWPYSTIGLRVTPADMLDTETLGYRYAAASIPEPSSILLASLAASMLLLLRRLTE